MYINCNAKPRHIKRRLSALDAHPSLLGRVSEIEIEIKPELFVKSRFNPRTTSRVSAFLRNTPRMPRLHTARFSGIRVEQEQLALLFQSNSLHTLILFQCSLQKTGYLPPSRIRHLTISLTGNWLHVEPLLAHCSANLETLTFVGELWRSPQSTKLQHFPRLRNLKFVASSGPMNHLDTLTSIAPQLEHLEVWGRVFVSGLSARPAGLNRVTINQWLMEHGDFGTHPSVSVSHLHLTNYDHVAGNDTRGLVVPIIQRIFPNLTSLEVDIHYCFYPCILLLARALPHVTRLQLNMSGIPRRLESNYDTSRYITEAPEGPLSSICVKVIPSPSQMKTMKLYKDWVIQPLLWPIDGIGGPHLQEVELVCSTPHTSTLAVWWCWKRVQEEWVFKQY